MSNLQRLVIENFKCFRSHCINFKMTTIMIGQNNAGKSTVAEALRIVGLACARFCGVKIYTNRPNWITDIPLVVKGINISSKVLDIDLEHIFNQYNDPPAIIKAYFEDDKRIDVYINSDSELFAVLFVNNVNITSNQKAQQHGIPNVQVLPQIVPLSKEEKDVTQNTLERNKLSHRSSGNFRSNLYLEKDTLQYNEFGELIESTWNGIKVNGIQKDIESKRISLYLRERDFVTEIYHMGHGAQMWLQIMWFIASIEKESIVVLDEPDVYMHADLQRKLIRLLMGKFKQTIIATHSVEIMSEVQPDEILIINRRFDESIFADGYPILQAALAHMGSIHNINLSRLLNNHTYLYLEGDDRDILKVFYDKIYPYAKVPLDHITSVSTGGWGSWDCQKANAKRLMAECKDIKTIFVYDRDYHTYIELEKRKKEAECNNIVMHIWSYKEIENYLLIPTAIARFIKSKGSNETLEELSENVSNLLDAICQDMKSDTLLSMVDARRQRNTEIKPVYSQCESEMNANWNDRQYRIKIISGKTAFSKLSQKCKEVFDVSFGTKQIASTMTIDEISNDIKQLLKEINNENVD